MEISKKSRTQHFNDWLDGCDENISHVCGGTGRQWSKKTFPGSQCFSLLSDYCETFVKLKMP